MTPKLIAESRSAAGLTQSQAAELVHATRDAWAKWESGARKMHPATWELFCIKTGASPDYGAICRRGPSTDTTPNTTAATATVATTRL